MEVARGRQLTLLCGLLTSTTSPGEIGTSSSSSSSSDSLPLSLALRRFSLTTCSRAMRAALRFSVSAGLPEREVHLDGLDALVVNMAVLVGVSADCRRSGRVALDRVTGKPGPCSAFVLGDHPGASRAFVGVIRFPFSPESPRSVCGRLVPT